MILRAVFWIAVVSFFMPREPDLGLGRPASDIGGLLASVEKSPGKMCEGHEGACATGFSLFNLFQGVAVHSLDAVKVDIERSRKHVQVADNLAPTDPD